MIKTKQKPKNNSKRKGERFEKHAIKSINSGAIWNSPLDYTVGDCCIDSKFTDKLSYRITIKSLEKIWNEALSMNKDPILEIGIRRNDDEIFVLRCGIILERYRKKKK